MYHHYFGFQEAPFDLTPNPKFLFLTQHHREALSALEYGLSTAKGVTALIGEAGTGKTTLLRAALESGRCRSVHCVYLMNPALTRAEFVQILSLQFGLSGRAGESKGAFLHELGDVLRERRTEGQISALVIDEAQNLNAELLEEVRLLANYETATEKLLPLVLAGQTELRDRLNEPGFRQLKQRVTLRCETAPFTVIETAQYVSHRVTIAGGDPSKVFTREAVMLIHERSRGIPRTISVMCDNALLTACGLGRQEVDSHIVREVARDFDLARGGHGAPQPVAPGDESSALTAPFSDTDTWSHDSQPEAVDRDERPMFAATRAWSRFSFFSR